MSRGVIMQSTLPRLDVRGIRHLAGTWPTGNGSLALCVRLFFLYKTEVPRGPLANDVAPLLFYGILLRTANRYARFVKMIISVLISMRKRQSKVINRQRDSYSRCSVFYQRFI